MSLCQSFQICTLEYMKNKILMMRRIINKLIIPNLSVSQSFQTRTLENVKNKILMECTGVVPVENPLILKSKTHNDL